MKKIVTLCASCFMLAGCPGKPPVGDMRPVLINGDHICFSVDKSDVLSFYNVSSLQDGEYKEFAVKSRVNLSYPDSCINTNLPVGYSYGIVYTLNNKNYRYTFFKDKDGKISSYN